MQNLLDRSHLNRNGNEGATNQLQVIRDLTARIHSLGMVDEKSLYRQEDSDGYRAASLASRFRMGVGSGDGRSRSRPMRVNHLSRNGSNQGD
jgi:hypothetical protein